MTPDLQRNERIEMLMWLLTVALLAMIAGVTITKAAEPCLTKQEARAKWPKAHIWWRTSERCWTNNPKRNVTYGKRHESKPPEEAKPHPAPPARADANGNVAGSVYVNEGEYNALDAQADNHPTLLYPTIMPVAEPPSALMLTPVVLTRWPVILDVDTQQTFAPWAYRAAGAFGK